MSSSISQNAIPYAGGCLTEEENAMLQEIYNKVVEPETIETIELVKVGTATRGGSINIAELYPDTYMNYTISDFFFKMYMAIS